MILIYCKKVIKKIVINFVIDLLSNKYYKIIYNLIFIIVNCCTKIIKYIFIIIKINIAKLVKVFFNKIVLYFETLASIVSHKRFVFTNIF